MKSTTMMSSSSPKRRRRLQQALRIASQASKVDPFASMERDGTNQKTPKTIPIATNRLRRTHSELQLQEDTAAAEWRDLVMFHRLVSGMRERQYRQRLQQERELRARLSKQPSANATSLSAYQDDIAFLQTERCVENIIETRRREIEVAESLRLDDEDWEIGRHRQNLDTTPACRRFSKGVAVTHTEAYGQFLDEEGRSSAPPPLFPDLAAASKDGAQSVFGPGPSVIANGAEDDKDEDDACSDEVFDIEF